MADQRRHASKIKDSLAKCFDRVFLGVVRNSRRLPGCGRRD
jgi:hypothetical protein